MEKEMHHYAACLLLEMLFPLQIQWNKKNSINIDISLFFVLFAFLLVR